MSQHFKNIIQFVVIDSNSGFDYTGYIQDISMAHLRAYLSRNNQSNEANSSNIDPNEPSNATLQTPAEKRKIVSAATQEVGDTHRTLERHDMQTILDPCSSTTSLCSETVQHVDDSDASTEPQTNLGLHNSETISYTYESFRLSDKRKKEKRSLSLSSKASPTCPLPGSESSASFKCSQCSKTYATSSNLTRHKQTHYSLESQAKKCEICGKAYVSMAALAMHLRTHTLSHACSVCGKRFSRAWLVKNHERSHTGEKPYGCAYCGKAYGDRSNLGMHLLKHSPNISTN